MDKKLVMLAILDGWGINEKEEGNAVKAAKTPNLDALMKQCPNTKIKTSGLDVGLPNGQMGNSEVGHTNIGAGRVVYQELTRITKSIEDGDFFSIPEFVSAIENCKKHGKNRGNRRHGDETLPAYHNEKCDYRYLPEAKPSISTGNLCG